MADYRGAPRDGGAMRYLDMSQGRTRARSTRPAGMAAAGIGIDFGTTNSAAAIFDGKEVTVVQLESTSPIMPSASYIDTDFTVRTGNHAIQSYIESNRGRRVELRAEVLGEGRTSTGQVDSGTGLPTTANTETIYGQELEDAGMPGRLFHGIKRLLGSRDSERVLIFGRPYRLVALITPILVRMKDAIDRQLAQTAAEGRGYGAAEPGSGQHRLHLVPVPPVTHACIGFPVRFEGSDFDSDSRALGRLSEACQHAGIIEQTFCPEPIAAAIAHLHKDPPKDTCRALAVDFGGGTLDLCVIRYEDKKLEVESVHGIALGGNKIDQAIFRELLFPLLGRDQSWHRVVDGRDVETVFPFWMYEEQLLNWQVTYTLNQNRYTTPLLDQMKKGGDLAKPFERLYHLIAQNYGYETFRSVRRLKERLSYISEDTLDIPEIDIHATLTRDKLNSIMSGALLQFEQAIDTTLRQTELTPGEIDIVLRTGGSLLIPAFIDILERRFPGKLVEQDPFTSVAAGLAIADYYGFGSSPGSSQTRI